METLGRPKPTTTTRQPHTRDCWPDAGHLLPRGARGSRQIVWTLRGMKRWPSSRITSGRSGTWWRPMRPQWEHP